MEPIPVPPMVFPDTSSTLAFVVLVLAVGIAFVLGTSQAVRLRGEPDRIARRAATSSALAVLAWFAVASAVSVSGVLEAQVAPPPALGFMLINLLIPAVAAFKQPGTRLLALPVAALIGFQVFRLPLELILHHWVALGTLPVQMTYSGRNFDIVTGLLALPTAWLVRAKPVPRMVVLAFNVVGSALLVNVASIAVLSSPVPFRTFNDGPPVLLAFHAPYGLIVPACVGAALFGHLLVFRWLWATRSPRQSTAAALL